MPRRASKGFPPDDPNEAAVDAVRRLTGQDGDEEPSPNKDQDPPEQEKNPYAVALGRLGAKKGGHARAAKLSPQRRRQITREAAAARWKKHRKGGDR